MNCNQIETDLLVYLDGKANPAARRRVEAHLAGCAICRERIEQFSSVWDILEELPRVVPTPNFDASVRAAVAAEPRRGSWLTAWFPSPRLALAACSLVAISVWLSSYNYRLPVSPARMVAQSPLQGTETEFGMIKDLPVLEDYDVLSNFDALSDLPVRPTAEYGIQRPQM